MPMIFCKLRGPSYSLGSGGLAVAVDEGRQGLVGSERVADGAVGTDLPWLPVRTFSIPIFATEYANFSKKRLWSTAKLMTRSLVLLSVWRVWSEVKSPCCFIRLT
ncbi:unnamed protein product [Spirodela intermedia]|uniref:Uncharacterized protein n=1 Tax=Spirodela intermedia TaxID=51605 RepID=A0A7I8IRS3_SPIIN|nr:unnamed protein product [Spirodela intermedia]CAA6660564.1 unnamed protein product [Spirodela intermedia]